MSKKELEKTKIKTNHDSPEEVNSDNQEVFEQKLNQEQPINKDEELKKLREKVNDLEKSKLLLLAEIDNKQKQFRKQIEEVYKYSNKKFIL